MGEGNALVHRYFNFSLNHLIIDTHILFIKKKKKKQLIYYLSLICNFGGQLSDEFNKFKKRV